MEKDCCVEKDFEISQLKGVIRSLHENLPSYKDFSYTRIMQLENELKTLRSSQAWVLAQFLSRVLRKLRKFVVLENYLRIIWIRISKN